LTLPFDSETQKYFEARHGVPAFISRRIGLAVIALGAGGEAFLNNYGPSGKNMPMLASLAIAFKAHHEAKAEQPTFTDELQSSPISPEQSPSEPDLPPADI